MILRIDFCLNFLSGLGCFRSIFLFLFIYLFIITVQILYPTSPLPAHLLSFIYSCSRFSFILCFLDHYPSTFHLSNPVIIFIFVGQEACFGWTGLSLFIYKVCDILVSLVGIGLDLDLFGIGNRNRNKFLIVENCKGGASEKRLGLFVSCNLTLASTCAILPNFVILHNKINS